MRIRIESCELRVASCEFTEWPIHPQLATRNSQLSVRKSESDDRQDRFDAILPGDLLSLFVAAAVVGDADLVDPQPRPELGDLRGDLRLEAEAVALQRRDLLEYRATKHLIADLHVRQVQIREGVAERGEELVPQR